MKNKCEGVIVVGSSKQERRVMKIKCKEGDSDRKTNTPGREDESRVEMTGSGEEK